MRALIFLILALILALPSLASDGVLEINRTCATQTGCFPGDPAGYPVTITGAAGRSYRLTSDLGVSGQDTTAIEIAASHTTIDLAGFRIICTSFIPPSTLQPCSEAGPGAGAGIAVADFVAHTGVEVRNGSVFGMPGNGVHLGIRSVARDLRISENGGTGISVGDGSTVSGNTIFENGGDGIFTGFGATVSGNTVSATDPNLGMLLNGNTGYRDNVINAERLIGGGGVNLGGNLCNGVVCP